MAMNDEETRRADRRRAHVRQDARRGRPENGRPRARGRTARAAGPRLEGQPAAQRQRRATRHRRPRGCVDERADEVGQRLPREPVRVRVGADREPRRRQAVEAEERRGRRAPSPTPTTPAKRVAPMMLTTDLALRVDPVYEQITRRFYEHPDELADAFAKAWYKLLHRDMGPLSRYLGPWVAEPQLWQDPVPAAEREPIDAADVAALKERSSPPASRSRGWSRPPGRPRRPSAAPTSAAARTARAYGWRRRRTGTGNEPAELAAALADAGGHPAGVQRLADGKRVSLADLIVLGGCAAVEQAAKDAGYDVDGRFAPGRTDASQEQTDVGVLRRARADRRRVPQLRPPGRAAAARARAAGAGVHADG